MTISFKCKKCGKGYKVSDDKAGKKVKCRQCSALIRIPEAEIDDFSEDWEEEEASFTPPQRRRTRTKTKSKTKSKGKKKSSSNSNQGLLVVGGIVGFLVVGGIAFFLISSGGDVMNSVANKVDQAVNSEGGAATVKISDVDQVKKIGRAFQDFHDSFIRFPPADAHLVDGKPLLSWRVHMLPFLGQEELYQQFNLKEPWDSPHNKALLEKIPAIYQCDGVSQPGYTSFMTFTGKGTPFTGGRGPQLRKFTDGASNTILFVKAGADKAVPWTQPIDIPMNESNPISALGQATEGIFLCATADGAIRKITVGLPAQVLKNAIQPDDGNPSTL